jgi:hypothetical protein
VPEPDQIVAGRGSLTARTPIPSRPLPGEDLSVARRAPYGAAAMALSDFQSPGPTAPPAPSGTLVAIPALDEAARISSIVARVRAAVPRADVVVVDDGSRDETGEQARRAGALCLRHAFNLGYGAALQTAYKYAVRQGYRRLVQLDADGQHDPAEVPRLLAPLERGEADVVIGSRFVNPVGYRMSTGRSIGRHLFGNLLQLLGGPRVADPTSGFQALSRPAFTLCCGDFFPSDFPDVDVLLFLHRQGLRLVEVPVAMAPSPPGHRSMHAGMRALYYPYKMCLALFRAVALPRAALYDRLPHGPSPS